MLNWKCSCYKKEMAVLVSWPKSILHVLSSPLQMIFFPPNLRDTALICTTTTFYKLLYWKWSFVQVTFFINNFPSFLMAKIAFEIGLFLSLGFGWNLYAVSNSYSILHICPAWRWERKALPTTWHLITGF